MPILTREQIERADDLPKRTVAVPEWGGEVIVKAVTVAERAEFDAWIFDPKRTPEERQREYAARMAALCMVDESGKRLYEGEEGVAALLKKSARAVKRIADVAEELNGFLSGSTEAAEKNSDTSPRADSSSS